MRFLFRIEQVRTVCTVQLTMTVRLCTTLAFKLGGTEDETLVAFPFCLFNQTIKKIMTRRTGLLVYVWYVILGLLSKGHFFISGIKSQGM